jgi:hypothetical protein
VETTFRADFQAGPRRLSRSLGQLLTVLALVCSGSAGIAASGCREALSKHAVCEAANAVALDTMRSGHLEAVSVMQDVYSGALMVFAASQPSRLDASTQVLPLSLAKVFLAASWWDRRLPDLLEGTPSGRSVDLRTR